ncbi:MAG TPA: AbrB/MazE/SpoVT family DNA-binding domain-containing protein [Terriglobales bacterium]|nr:AbrB/MazE/SpoVT family DNA-binding domain-containing protein [Terriglobales bacterium]
MSDVVKVGPRGQIQLPRRLRAEFVLNEGDELLADIEGEAIVLRRKAKRFSEYLEKLGGSPRRGR